MTRQSFVTVVLAALLAVPASAATRLYWLIPDGLRADEKVYDVFRWAQEGKLPNIKKMMDQGSWGYSIPAFPSHTPTNFATLTTGSYPETHGIADGSMRVEGFPLSRPSVNGFSSNAKKVPPVWRTLEKAGLNVTLLSIPGSTPPELDAGSTIRGRWGGWGADFHALNFESLQNPEQRQVRGLGVRLFYQGSELTRYVPLAPATGWSKDFVSRAPARELAMLAYGTTVYAFLSGTGDAKSPKYSEVALSLDKKTVLARLARSNDWSPWTPVTLSWSGQALDTSVRVCLIKLSADGFLKMRLLFDVVNETIVQPSELAQGLRAGAGPMVDYPDNWPAQLNRLPEERQVLLSEAHMALDWHQRAAAFLLSDANTDVLIQDTYVPNQMLESRWWMRRIDPSAPDYAATSKADRARRLEEILGIYQGIDAILGSAMKAAGPDAVFVLSSDHGVLPIKKEVALNNLLAREGLLVFTLDPKSGEPVVDWARSKVAFLKMIGIYIGPAGLAGPWKRGSGPEYEALRKRVTGLVAGLKDGGAPVVDRIVPWEKAAELRLPKDRVPDLILAMNPGYALTEDMDLSGDVLRIPLQSGYKQAVLADGNPGLWTPFVIMGPGVKKGFRIREPLRNPDQEPTLLTLLGVPLPPHIQGRVLTEILERAR